MVVRDGDCLRLDDVKDKRNEIRIELGLERVEVCVVVDEMEGWLLADEKAIGNYIGLDLHRFGAPEEIKKPSREIKNIFRRVGRNYLKSGGILGRLLKD